jgi:hypothetical protein
MATTRMVMMAMRMKKEKKKDSVIFWKNLEREKMNMTKKSLNRDLAVFIVIEFL